MDTHMHARTHTSAYTRVHTHVHIHRATSKVKIYIIQPCNDDRKGGYVSTTGLQLLYNLKAIHSSILNKKWWLDLRNHDNDIVYLPAWGPSFHYNECLFYHTLLQHACTMYNLYQKLLLCLVQSANILKQRKINSTNNVLYTYLRF